MTAPEIMLVAGSTGMVGHNIAATPSLSHLGWPVAVVQGTALNRHGPSGRQVQQRRQVAVDDGVSAGDRDVFEFAVALDRRQRVDLATVLQVRG